MSLPVAGRVRALLLDADGNLFPSEEPAFEAATRVVNALLAELGVDRAYEADVLRAEALGRNFRALAGDLAAEHGRDLDPAVLDAWVRREQQEVTAHLRATLEPEPDLLATLERLAARYELAVVSSSGLARLDACFDVTGQAGLLPAERRFSAEDSLPAPTSKPDPAVYRHALDVLGLAAEEAVAVEDSPTGVRSAVAAGIATIGNLVHVPPAAREAHAATLREAGAAVVVDGWPAVERLLA